MRKSHSEYTSKDNKSKVIHEDLMIIYPANEDSPTKAIYFDNEGHVINYTITFLEKSIVFTSEKVANNPIFRLTYTLLTKKLVNTKFEMSFDGEHFTTYVKGNSKKKK